MARRICGITAARTNSAVRSLRKAISMAYLTLAGIKHQTSFGILRNLQSLSKPNSGVQPRGTSQHRQRYSHCSRGCRTRNGYAQPASTGTELFARDAVQWNQDWASWLGLRHTQLNRHGVLTDGSQSTSLKQDFTTPWLSTGYQFMPEQQVYVSWGEGVPSAQCALLASGTPHDNDGAPCSAAYAPVGMGVKGHCSQTHWGVNLFRTQSLKARDWQPLHG